MRLPKSVAFFYPLLPSNFPTRIPGSPFGLKQKKKTLNHFRRGGVKALRGSRIRMQSGKVNFLDSSSHPESYPTRPPPPLLPKAYASGQPDILGQTSPLSHLSSFQTSV